MKGLLKGGGAGRGRGAGKGRMAWERLGRDRECL